MSKVKKSTGQGKRPPQSFPKKRRNFKAELLNTPYVGYFRATHFGGEIHPLHRKVRFPVVVCDAQTAQKLKPREVVSFSCDDHGRVTIHEVIGSLDEPRMFSLLAINQLGLPATFSNQALTQAAQGKVPSPHGRVDLRAIPLVTIDGEDARDFDDAVYAKPNPDEPGGWIVIVAIADVAYYVREDTSLDSEAYARGNSVYFPDRVVPMLPEALSNELCSLKPGVDRACMAVRLHINVNGKITDFEFMRGLMRSHARLTYNQVQLALEGQMDATTGPLYESVIQPLYGVFQALLKARHHRGTIDFDLPEYQVFFNNDHNLSHIASRVRLKSHQLIEELMIAANVAAAMTLKEKKWPCLYRIHDEPDPQRFENLKAMLKAYKLAVPAPKKLTPHFFNQVLAKVQGHHAQTLINQLMLRCQAQAVYGPDPKASHFGLSLAHYTHFTSPIRRYSDLVVHRALIGALGLGEGGEATPPSLEKLQAVGMHLSQRERVAVQAERETMERYVAAWMADKVGQIFDAQIVGINRAGLFVGLSRWGAEGFLSVSNLTGDYFVFEEHLHRFVGRHTRQVYQLGDFIRVKLEVADPISSSISFRLANTERPQTSQVKSGAGKAKARKKGYNQEESVDETPSRKKPYKQKNPEPPKPPRGRNPNGRNPWQGSTTELAKEASPDGPKPPRGKNLNGRNPRKGSATESLTKGNPHQPRPSQKKGKRPRAIP